MTPADVEYAARLLARREQATLMLASVNPAAEATIHLHARSMKFQSVDITPVLRAEIESINTLLVGLGVAP